MKLFVASGDAEASNVMDTVSVATKAGFTNQSVDEGHVFCSVPDTMELVDVFPDGSWEYQDVLEDKTMRTMSGASAVMLSMYLHSEENKKMFEELSE